MPTSAPDEPGPRPPAWRVYGPRLAVALLLVAVLAVSYALGLGGIVWDYVRSNLDLLKAQVEEHLLAALLLFFLTYLAVTALSVPVAAPLSIVTGALFGRWLGTDVVLLAASLGATLAMLVSRYLFRDLLRQRFGDRMRGLDEGVERDGAYYLLTLRLVPLVPFWLINLGMGLTRLRATTFFAVSLVGMLPGTYLYVNAGTELSRLHSPADVLSPTLLISLALLGAVPLLLRKMLVWRSRGAS